ncbi:MAG TPA: hypothetical protein VHE83_18335 [Mycobacteriales bacterium]|nr:hypothetical protein [Mycobacteriales bacterium]
MRWLAAFLLTLTLLTGRATAAPGACDPSATSCESGPVVTTTVGTTSYSGLLYVPGDEHVFDVQQRADGCAGCTWETVVICSDVAPDETSCLGGEDVCDWGDTYLEVRLIVGGVVQDLSHWCRHPSDPPPTGLDEHVPSEAELQKLVTTAPTMHADPPGPLLAQLPAFLWADDPGPVRTVGAVPGYPGLTLTLVLTPATWAWDFGDGSPVRTTADPGGPYPGGDVRHTFHATGPFTVGVTEEWRARATLTTPFGALPSRDEPRTVSSPIGRERLTVREARAVLIGGSS